MGVSERFASGHDRGAGRRWHTRTVISATGQSPTGRMKLSCHHERRDRWLAQKSISWPNRPRAVGPSLASTIRTRTTTASLSVTSTTIAAAAGSATNTTTAAPTYGRSGTTTSLSRTSLAQTMAGEAGAAHDVLVIGGGGAGLRAAIAVAEADARLSVAVVSK